MQEPITLTEQEIQDITGLVRPSAQRKWLRNHYGIDAEPRGDGSLSVPRRLYYQKAGLSQQPKREPRMRFSNVS